MGFTKRKFDRISTKKAINLDRFLVEIGVKMLPKTPTHTQGNLFQSPLPDMLDIQDPLIIPADSIDW